MQDFETKRKNLFNCLDEIADKNLKGTILDQTEFEKDPLHTRKHIKISQNEDLSISRLRGKESLFKKPDLPIAKCLKPRFSPDYKVNPHKWTKYSLDDADISDRMNTTAAFEFLKDMENKRNQEEKDSDANDEIETIGNKVVFNKSTKLKRCIRDVIHSSEEEKPILKGSKVVMPEYVVGGKKPSKNKKTQLNRRDIKNATKELTLSHLLDIDEVNDDI